MGCVPNIKKIGIIGIAVYSEKVVGRNGVFYKKITMNYMVVGL
jgi:hypothetical protein